MKQFISFLMVCLLSVLAQARSWQKVYVPGAVCGSGEPYYIFLDTRSEKKLLVEFMGGGACWSAATCYGAELKTWIHEIPELPYFSYTSDDTVKSNPFKDHAMIYFPYCTGDVFAGHHTAEYLPGIETYHVGYANVEKTLAYLEQNNFVKFENFDEVTLTGSSAGAIGAMVHSKTIQPYLSADATKILIADSPGLHFGKTFWNKFTAAEISDFQEEFGKINLHFDIHDGNVAQYLAPALAYLSDWHISILQSTKDIVMSAVFGDISPFDHEALVLGPKGLPAIAAPFANVKTWIPHSFEHTFLLTHLTSEIEDQNDISAWNFTKTFYSEAATAAALP